jgi:hypothetical protein
MRPQRTASQRPHLFHLNREHNEYENENEQLVYLLTTCRMTLSIYPIPPFPASKKRMPPLPPPELFPSNKRPSIRPPKLVTVRNPCEPPSISRETDVLPGFLSHLIVNPQHIATYIYIVPD